MIDVKFYQPSFTPDTKITYSVIAAKFRNNWLFVRHKDRDTWEIPGGHIENFESPDQAAYRELVEETGAVRFTIECVATYSVTEAGKTGYGRLYLAKITQLGSLSGTSEIREVRIMDSLPANLTHPFIQPVLFQRIRTYIDLMDQK